MTNDRRWRAAASGPVAGLLVMASAALTPGPAAADVRIDAGGGVFVPFDDGHRDVFGSSPAFGLGVSSVVGRGGARLFLDVAHVRASGDEVLPDDTFSNVAPVTRYRLWPVTLGARFDLNHDPAQDLRVFIGLGFRTVFTDWEREGEDGSDPTFGALLELRPEYRAGDRWTVWLRQRLDLLRDNNLGSRFVKIDYSGTMLELGLSFGLDDLPLTPPRFEP